MSKPTTYTITDKITGEVAEHVERCELADKLATMFDTTQDGVQQAIDDLASKAAAGEYYDDEAEFLNVKVEEE